MKFIFCLCLVILVVACDDPSLDNSIDNDTVIEPVIDRTELASITVAETTASNITRTINFNYNNDNLLSLITDDGATDNLYACDYSNANRLEFIEQTLNGQVPQLVTVTTEIDTNSSNAQEYISLQFNTNTSELKEYRLFTDQQNRIDQIIVLLTDSSGVTTLVSNRTFTYSQNFNVSRINKLTSNGITTAYTDFTYNFNNNPFKDMNDVIRSFLFDEFNPYSRNLPATRDDYTVSTNGVTLVKSITYDYTLNADGFPTQRELQVTENGTTTAYFEIFNYRP